MWGNRVHVITQRLSYVYSPTLTPTYSPKNFNFSTHIVHVCKHIVENTYIGTDENNKNVFFNYMLRITPHCIILSLNASRSTTTKIHFEYEYITICETEKSNWPLFLLLRSPHQRQTSPTLWSMSDNESLVKG